MRDLVSKDLILNWIKPTVKLRGTKADPTYLSLYNKKTNEKRKFGQTYIKFNTMVVEENFFDKENCTVAFSFDEKTQRLIMVFDPPKGVPFYKLSKSKKDRYLYNRDLVDKISEFFKLESELYLLKMRRFTQLNDMQLFILTPHTLNKEPIFEYEKDGELFKISPSV